MTEPRTAEYCLIQRPTGRASSGDPERRGIVVLGPRGRSQEHRGVAVTRALGRILIELDEQWAPRLLNRLAGMADEEYLWEPVPESWSVGLIRFDGQVRCADYAA